MIFMGKRVAVSEENKARAASYYQPQPSQVIFELLFVHFRLWRHFLSQLLFEAMKNGKKKTFAWHAVEELEITTYATVHLTGI